MPPHCSPRTSLSIQYFPSLCRAARTGIEKSTYSNVARLIESSSGKALEFVGSPILSLKGTTLVTFPKLSFKNTWKLHKAKNDCNSMMVVGVRRLVFC